MLAKRPDRAQWLTSAPWLLYVVLTASAIVSLMCIVRMWREKGQGVGSRILWTMVLLLPVFGPVFFGALHEAPNVQPEHERASESSIVVDVSDVA